ncbi:MAG: futalosine hydrolase [Sphingobacterium sp.]
MDILVVAASRDEIAPSLGFLEEHNTRFLISGVGMLQTAFSLGAALQEKRADLIIQVGIGGILDPAATLGEVYQITHEEIFDFGAQDHIDFLSMESLGLARGSFSQRIPSGLELPSLRLARGITVNTVHGNQQSIRALASRYPIALVESMEGAAAFFAAEQTQTAVLQYRAISNYIEPRNRQGWAIGPAVANLNRFLQQFLSGIG